MQTDDQKMELIADELLSKMQEMSQYSSYYDETMKVFILQKLKEAFQVGVEFSDELHAVG